MICADIVEGAASVPVFSPAASQPADMQGCSAVVLTGADTSALATYAFPTSEDAGQAWSLGFVLVVSAYVLGWAPGAILNFMRSR